MAKRIPETSVSPAGAGSISITELTPVETATETIYRFRVTATAGNTGYRFSHFHVKETQPDGTQYEFDIHPTSTETPPFVREFSWASRKDSSPDYGTLSIVAVYQALIEHVVTTTCIPYPQSGEGGCTATVNGLTTEDSYGLQGDERMCSMVANPGPHWRFVRWEEMHGKFPSRTTPTFAYSFTYLPGASYAGENWRAVFVPKTNLIVRDANGKIVRDSQGRIVRDY